MPRPARRRELHPAIAVIEGGSHNACWEFKLDPDESVEVVWFDSSDVSFLYPLYQTLTHYSVMACL